MKTKLLTIAMTAVLMLTAMTKVHAQNFEGPCLPSMHGLDDHQSAFCGSTQTQTIALYAGVNWFSTYVEITLDDLKAALVDALGTSATITVKSRTVSVKYQRGRWAGNLTSLNLAEMYKIDVPADCEISLEGMPINAATLSVTISSGANWIAYPLFVDMTLTDAFSGFAVNGDAVYGQTLNAKVVRGRWTGQLTELEPGKGYIYFSNDANNRVFTFPTNSK